MSQNTLVAYASEYGSTREVAEDIGRVLSERGAHVNVAPIDYVDSLGRYGSVVAGSAVQQGDWIPQFSQFLREQRPTLSRLPVWLFSCGPPQEDVNAYFRCGTLYPRELEPVIRFIKPRELRLFGGMVNPNKLMLDDWCRYRQLRATVGDFHDWEEIEDWANGIATALGLAGASQFGPGAERRQSGGYGAS